MTINSRAKGAGAEREFANIIHDWCGIRLIRNLEQTRSGGHDLIVHSDEQGRLADEYRTLAIECKRYSKATPAMINKWWHQANEQAQQCQLHPILAFRIDRQEWQVITPLYLINPSLSKSRGLENAAVLSAQGFCGVISELSV